MNQRIEEIFKKRTGRSAGNIKPGLDRVTRVYEYLGRPGAKTKTVLIGGTNGKGSTAAFLYRILGANGQKIGLFTSPHLFNFSERIQISNLEFGCIDDAYLSWQIARLEKDLPAQLYDQLSFFEINTILALRVFEEFETSVNILEVGLGGRWDSTNIVDPEVSCITSIGWDHMDWLGDSLEKIAQEKSGIMRAHKTTIWSGSLVETVNATIEEAADKRGANLKSLEDCLEIENRNFILNKKRIYFPEELGDLSRIQKKNFATAYAIANEIETGVKIDSFSRMYPAPPCQRGRFETGISSSGVPYIIDVCHNRDGLEEFVCELRRRGLTKIPKQKIYVSMLRDKDIAGNLAILQKDFDIQIFLGEGERSLRREDINPIFPVFKTFAEAMKTHTSAMGPIIVCGSIIALSNVWQDLSSPC